jgi:hypothetical protein
VRSHFAGDRAGKNAGYANIVSVEVDHMAKQQKKLPGHEPRELAPLIDALEVPAGAGADLLREAVTQYRGERRQEVIAQVKRLIERIAQGERLIRKSTKQIALCKAQLMAIDAGEFVISEQTLQIVYTDELLNIPWDSTASW